jgi:sugar phosphate isomerase/epimerase
MSKISVQLFGLGKEIENEFQGTFENLKSIGYEAVELAVLFGGDVPKIREAVKEIEKYFGLALPASVWTPSEAYRNMEVLKEKGLTAASCHVFCVAAYEGMLTEVLPEIVEFSKKTGISNYVVSYMIKDKIGCEKFAKDINETINILSPYGITLCYHNHETECKTIEENQTVLDYLFQLCDERLKLQVDIGWADFAGVSVTDFMKKYKDRIVSVHLKDFKANACPENVRTSFAAVGEGRVPTLEALKIAKEYPVFEYGIIVDQDESKISMLADLETAYKNISEMFKHL